MLSYLYLGASLSLYGSVELDSVLNYVILNFHNKSVMNPLARFSGSAPATSTRSYVRAHACIDPCKLLVLSTLRALIALHLGCFMARQPRDLFACVFRSSESASPRQGQSHSLLALGQINNHIDRSSVVCACVW